MHCSLRQRATQQTTPTVFRMNRRDATTPIYDFRHATVPQKRKDVQINAPYLQPPLCSSLLTVRYVKTRPLTPTHHLHDYKPVQQTKNMIRPYTTSLSPTATRSLWVLGCSEGFFPAKHDDDIGAWRFCAACRPSSMRQCQNGVLILDHVHGRMRMMREARHRPRSFVMHVELVIAWYINTLLCGTWHCMHQGKRNKQTTRTSHTTLTRSKHSAQARVTKMEEKFLQSHLAICKARPWRRFKNNCKQCVEQNMLLAM